MRPVASKRGRNESKNLTRFEKGGTFSAMNEGKILGCQFFRGQKKKVFKRKRGLGNRGDPQ